MLAVADLASLSIIGFLLFPWYIGNVWWGAAMIVNELLNHVWHFLFRSGGSVRPSKAMNCSIVNQGGRMGGQPGFPSGHMSHIGLFFTLAYLFYKAVWILIVGIVAVVVMGWARLEKSCHTFVQLVAGLAFGIVFGIVYFFISLKVVYILRQKYSKHPE